MTLKWPCWIALGLALGNFPAMPASAAPPEPAAVFADGAVLQRDQPVIIWGHAEPAQLVSVSFDGLVKQTRADPAGKWSAEFPARDAAEGLSLVVEAGGERAERSGISIGDVFLCSGQSNMQFSMAETALNPGERNLPIDRSIALLSVPIATARLEQSKFAQPAGWSNAHAGSADFSAVCLIAGRALAQQQKVPVGLIDASMGGTPIEAWLPYDGLRLAGGPERAVAILDAFRADPVAAEAQFGEGLDAMWKMPPPPGQDPDRPRMGYANLFNAMIAPLQGLKLAGVIWYQGENNTRREDARIAYQTQLRALLASWRKRFGQTLPFVIVQLAPFGPLAGEPVESNWAEVREAQRRVAQEDPYAELVITSDVGERLDIHPPLKKPVGQRAAAAMNHLRFGGSDAALGPRPKDAHRNGNTVFVSILGSNAGLMAASWGRPGPIILCRTGAGRECRFVDALLAGDGIEVAIPEGFEPDLVRYCWGAAPICNVFDRQQRPLGPFELAIANGAGE